MVDAVGFYTTREVARLARINLRTLYEWQQRRIAIPSVTVPVEGKSVRGYSYADLTILRLLRALREDEIDFDSAVRALRHLYDRLGPPSQGWADAKVYFVGNKIYTEQPDSWPLTSATEGGQTVAEQVFGDLFGELRQIEDEWSLVVPQQFRPYVMINPSIMGGLPVIRRTRIPTETIARLHDDGVSTQEIASYYPSLDEAVVKNAIAYEEELDTEATAA